MWKFFSLSKIVSHIKYTVITFGIIEHASFHYGNFSELQKPL